jgi:aryl-alcohol dehydrogenase-like predicted oxidoreductase
VTPAGRRWGPSALGTAEFGTHLAHDVCHALLDHYTHLGGTLIDTAPTYGDPGTGEGRAEPLIGAWLNRTGASVAVATKAGLDPMTRRPDLDPATLIRSAHHSRNTLDRSIDVLLLHRDDPHVPADEIADALTQLIHDGTINHVGVSNWHPHRIVQIAAILQPGPGLHATAPAWSLARRSPAATDPELIEADPRHLRVARDNHLQVLPFRTAALGYFTDPATVSRRHAAYRDSVYDTPANRGRRTRARRLADQLGRTPHQIALAWLASADVPTTPVIGAANITQLAEAMAGCTTVLTAQQRRYLDTGRTS